MLLRHSTYYIFARGLPGLVNFAALAIFTRLLAPDEFGRYAMVLAGVGLLNVAVFQWLRLVLGRFLQASHGSHEVFLAGILSLFLTLAVALTGLGLLLAILWPDPVWQRLLILAIALLVTQAWFELNLSLARAKIKPVWYGKLLGSKSLLSLVLGGALAWFGFGAAAPIFGLVVAHTLSIIMFSLGVWRGIWPRWPSRQVLRAQLSYGLPLTLSFALAWVVSGSDRILIAWLLDESAVGNYAAGYDLSFHSLTLLLVVINTAAYPLAIAAMETGGPENARKQLTQNGQLIVSAALSGCIGLLILSSQLVEVMIGEEYRVAALTVLPWVAIAAVAAGLKSYHFDVAFHLSYKSRWQALTVAIAAIANIILNLLLIPRYGIVGAAWATLAAFVIAAALSAWLGSRLMDMPAILPLFAKATFIAVLVGTATHAASSLSEVPWKSLVFGLFLGALMALSASWLVNLCGCRTALGRYFKSL